MSAKLLLSILGAICLITFVTFSYLVHKNHFTTIDFNTTVRLQDHISRHFDEPFSFLSEVGKFEVVTVFLVLLFIITKKVKAGIASFGFFVMFHLIEIYGKNFVHHPPPPGFMVRTLDLIPLSPFDVRTQNSYPSGHAGRALFVSVVLLTLLWQSKRFTMPIKISITLFVLAYDAVMLVSRVYLGEHWLSDIIGGSLLGAAMGLFAGAFLVNSQSYPSTHAEKKSGHSLFPKYTIEIKKVN